MKILAALILLVMISVFVMLFILIKKDTRINKKL